MTRIASLFVLFALAGCGNKGPLVMPGPAPEAAAPAAAAQPATPAPASTEPATPEPAASTSGTPAR